MADPALARQGPLAGLGEAGGVLSVLPPASRFAFRGGREAARKAGDAFGVPLPLVACHAATGGERAALWLGPDEWLLLAPADAGLDIARRLADGLGDTAHSLVDIGHRDAAIGVAGADCEAIVNAGCPLDLDLAAFAVGMCTRTVFARVGIVLWRCAENRFRIEAARSVARHLWALLEEARLDHERLPATPGEGGPDAARP